MIEVTNVSVNLSHKEIIKNISLQIRNGRIVMILGENGSGKTTLIKTMLAWYQMSSGSITVDGVNINKMNEKQRAAVFAYVPQIKEKVEGLLVEECIVSGVSRQLSLFATPTKKDYLKVDRILTRLHLTKIKGKQLDEISGGELQMTYLARALVQEAQVILMDEPCTYLDYHRQHLFLQETKRLKETDHSVFISIHDPNLALQYADEIIVIHQGEICAHLQKETHDMRKAIEVLYNKIYGKHFSLNSENEYLVWKEE